VLLAYLGEAALDDHLLATVFQPLTERTVTQPTVLRRLLREVRRADFAAVEDELDYGIVSVAVPVRAPDREVIAAINCSTSTSRVRKAQMIEERVPQLRLAAERIEAALRRFPALVHSIQR
jgi:IclR family pca regulon transcriptional regulator